MAKKILLADDSITIQKVVELTFAEGDYEVTCASDGAQAIRKIEETPPDIALIDVMMPQRNGYDVCAHIKQDPNLAWIPVLLLTGTFEPFDPRRADQVGADGHIIKPFESRSLVTQVEELMTQHPRPAPPEGQEAPIAEPEPEQRAVSSPEPEIRPEQEEEPAPPPAPPEPPPVPSGPATVRMDSRTFFSQLESGGELPEEPHQKQEEQVPSLGPLDLPDAGEDAPETDPTHPIPAASPEPAQASASSSADENPQPGEAPPLPGLPREEMEKLARETMEARSRQIAKEIAEKVVREVAWEVIPELAEALIKRRLRELEEEASSEESAAPLH